jgi:hypothetical protein
MLDKRGFGKIQTTWSHIMIFLSNLGKSSGKFLKDSKKFKKVPANSNMIKKVLEG